MTNMFTFRAILMGDRRVINTPPPSKWHYGNRLVVHGFTAEQTN